MATVVHSLEELKEQIEQRMRRGMVEASSTALQDMKSATQFFYHGGFPKKYKRTGALGNTPEVETVTGDSSGMRFTARLNQDHQYSTGDNPSMNQVLQLANYGNPWVITNPHNGDEYLAKPTVGSQGFWEKAEEDIKQHTREALERNLHK